MKAFGWNFNIEIRIIYANSNLMLTHTHINQFGSVQETTDIMFIVGLKKLSSQSKFLFRTLCYASVSSEAPVL